MADPISSVATPDPMLACNPVKEYFAPETGSCLLCSKHCNGCVGPTASDCLQCHKYLFFSRCVYQCPIGFEPGQELLSVEDSDVKCQMSDSIAALFAICSLALVWFTIVVICKWRRSRKLIKQYRQANFELQQVTGAASDYKPTMPSPSLSRTLTDRNTMLNKGGSGSLNRGDKLLVGWGSDEASDRQSLPRTLYGATAMQL
ncbi:uncharacterized protein LOC134844585 [Symsagittifera roscoffensis]|uniref:uncharacterized protein LOC134844585 n=1 Tax=Symsagittifera roscoffensis TaxID=84072 RepID=UPI00307CA97E